MKKIAYISRVWGSLEDSYAGYLKKCPDLSRNLKSMTDWSRL